MVYSAVSKSFRETVALNTMLLLSSFGAPFSGVLIGRFIDGTRFSGVPHAGELAQTGTKFRPIESAAGSEDDDPQHRGRHGRLRRCLLATTPLARSKGLLGRSSLAPGEGMLFRPAGSIHMFFMRFAIDAVFCDRELVVLEVVQDLRPWRMAGTKERRW